MAGPTRLLLMELSPQRQETAGLGSGFTVRVQDQDRVRVRVRKVWVQGRVRHLASLTFRRSSTTVSTTAITKPKLKAMPKPITTDIGNGCEKWLRIWVRVKGETLG